MALTINSNVAALVARDNLSASASRLNSSLEKLSTGLSINKGADNSAGLVLSEIQRGQISGLNQAVKNIDRAVTLTQTADGALGEISDVLVRIRELAVANSSGGGLDSDASTANNTEATALVGTITDIVNRTKFGEKVLLDGGFDQTFHVGTFSGDSEVLSIDNVSAAELGINALNITSVANATAAITTLDTAIKDVAVARAEVGSFQANTLQRVKSAVQVQANNLQAAEQSLRETDFASEIAKFTNEQIRQQAATTVLGLANQNAQGVLSLLG